MKFKNNFLTISSQGNQDDQAAAIAKAQPLHNFGNQYPYESIFNSIFPSAVESNLLGLQKSLAQFHFRFGNQGQDVDLYCGQSLQN